MKNNHLELTDTHQTFWQLAAIQLSGWTSLPILATSILILQVNSFLGAIFTIIVGNAIIWFIRLGIVVMSYKKRQSMLDITRDYLGMSGGYFIAVVSIASTLMWFITQTTAASSTLTHLITIRENPTIDKFTQMSVLLGVTSTFLCMEGMVLLRRLTTIAFPILLVTFFVCIFTMPFQLPEKSEAGLSLAGLALVLSTNLGITSDLPTFFRHSKSLQTSVVALTVIQLIGIVIAICSLYFGLIINRTFDVNDAAVLSTGNNVLRASLVIFVFLSVICANVANVYSASVGWEILAPKALVGRKEYLILGLGLTTIFILISNLFSVEYLLEAADSSLVNLCMVLLAGYMISRLRKRLPHPHEQKAYFFAWALASVINCIQFSEPNFIKLAPLVTGIIAIIIFLGGYFLTRNILQNRRLVKID